jgi:hypothetical protein
MALPRNAQLWLPGLLADRLRRRHEATTTTTVWLMFADHYEPCWQRPDDATAVARVQAWHDAWPAIAARHRDDTGRPAQYTFFFPEEDYRAELLAPLAEMTHAGVADVEVHIHHDREGEADFVSRIQRFVRVLRDEHGLLHDVDGRPGFGFIHGNWALDNAHPTGKWCGLDNELTLLRALGCYADYTLPAAPDPCQTRRVNAIYWAVDDPTRPKSHDDGPLLVPGQVPPREALLMVQGPLTVTFPRHRRFRPTLEVGELAGHAPVTPDRVRAWLDVAPRVGEDVILKLHTHGAPEKNAGPLLGRDLEATLAGVRAECQRRGWGLRFATAWDVYQQLHTHVGVTPLPD